MPRPLCSVAKDSLSDRSGTGLVPGSAPHQARGLPPARRALKNSGPCVWVCQMPSIDLRQLPGRRLTYGRLCACVARRDRQPQHVAERACVAIGDCLSELEHLRTQDGLGRDDLGDEGELAGVLGVIDSIGHEAVDQSSGETDLDPAADHDQLVERGRHEVVEWSVEVRKTGVDGDLSDRDRCGAASSAGLAFAARLRGGVDSGTRASCCGSTSSLPSPVTMQFYQPAADV